jgi:hypothetical protein
VLGATGLPAHYDALDEEGGLRLGYLEHKDLDASAPFYRAPEPWVKVVAGPSKQDPQAYKEWWDQIGNFPGEHGRECISPCPCPPARRKPPHWYQECSRVSIGASASSCLVALSPTRLPSPYHTRLAVSSCASCQPAS